VAGGWHNYAASLVSPLTLQQIERQIITNGLKHPQAWEPVAVDF